jgi:hypothetical protein
MQSVCRYFAAVALKRQSRPNATPTNGSDLRLGLPNGFWLNAADELNQRYTAVHTTLLARFGVVKAHGDTPNLCPLNRLLSILPEDFAAERRPRFGLGGLFM